MGLGRDLLATQRVNTSASHQDHLTGEGRTPRPSARNVLAPMPHLRLSAASEAASKTPFSARLHIRFARLRQHFSALLSNLTQRARVCTARERERERRASMAQPTPTPQRKRELLTARLTTDRGGQQRAAGGGRPGAGGGRRIAVFVWRWSMDLRWRSRTMLRSESAPRAKQNAGTEAKSATKSGRVIPLGMSMNAESSDVKILEWSYRSPRQLAGDGAPPAVLFLSL